MTEVKANIKLYSGERMRETPFYSGYRPVFSVDTELMTSGQITLLDRDCFYPGDEAIVLIKFLNVKLLGSDFGIGSHLIFREGRYILGEGTVLEILPE